MSLYSRSLATVPLLTELCVKHIVQNFEGNTYHTKYMADGAIEGNEQSYMVQSPFSYDFEFSRFLRDGIRRNVNRLDGYHINMLS